MLADGMPLPRRWNENTNGRYSEIVLERSDYMDVNLDAAVAMIESDKQAAKTAFTRCVRDYPDDWRGYFYLAACLSNQLDYEGAIRHLGEANALSPDDPLIHFNLGYCQRQLGHHVEAVANLETSARIYNWRDPRCTAVLASTFSILGENGKALEAISRARSNGVQHPILDFYQFIIDSANASKNINLKDQLVRHCRDQDVVDYLVAFSMKYDFFRYNILDDKYSLASLIAAYQRQQNLDPWAYHPETYLLPEEADLHCEAAKSNLGSHWIIKARNLSGGQGAHVVKGPVKETQTADRIAQRYITEPYLLEGRKFNLRIYFVIVSTDPLEVHLWRDGVVFIAPQPFSLKPDDLGQATIHIANLLTVGKEAENFPLATIKSHILSLKDMLALDVFTPNHREAIEERVSDLVIRFCQAVGATGLFEEQARLGPAPGFPPKFLGLDIIFDKHLKPWLLEAERYPGIGGVFSTTKNINNRFKTDYLDLVLGNLRFDNDKFMTIHP